MAGGAYKADRRYLLRAFRKIFGKGAACEWSFEAFYYDACQAKAGFVHESIRDSCAGFACPFFNSPMTQSHQSVPAGTCPGDANVKLGWDESGPADLFRWLRISRNETARIFEPKPL